MYPYINKPDPSIYFSLKYQLYIFSYLVENITHAICHHPYCLRAMGHFLIHNMDKPQNLSTNYLLYITLHLAHYRIVHI